MILKIIQKFGGVKQVAFMAVVAFVAAAGLTIINQHVAQAAYTVDPTAVAAIATSSAAGTAYSPYIIGFFAAFFGILLGIGLAKVALNKGKAMIIGAIAGRRRRK